MADEAFHEIQLNGKQLVFMFMATTVVAVVIFLAGVMVGRGVPVRAAGGERSLAPPNGVVDPTAGPAEPAAPAARSSAPSSGTPVTGQETLTYAGRLEAPTPPRETLKNIDSSPAPPKSAPAPAPAPVARGAVVPEPAAVPQALAEPGGDGWAVQVMAVPLAQRSDAEALARRLTAKGYPAYVMPRGNRFAVRVGKYPNQREAEAISARLKKEEQFDPWVTR